MADWNLPAGKRIPVFCKWSEFNRSNRGWFSGFLISPWFPVTTHDFVTGSIYTATKQNIISEIN